MPDELTKGQYREALVIAVARERLSLAHGMRGDIARPRSSRSNERNRT